MKKSSLMGKAYACIFFICVASFYTPQSLAITVQLTASIPDGTNLLVGSGNFTSTIFSFTDVDTIDIMFADMKHIDIVADGNLDIAVSFSSTSPIDLIGGTGGGFMSLLNENGNPLSTVPMVVGEGGTQLEGLFTGSYPVDTDVLFHGIRLEGFGVLNIDPITDSSLTFEATQGGLMSVGTWVPIPPAIWLFGTGLLGLIGISRHKKAAQV